MKYALAGTALLFCMVMSHAQSEPAVQDINPSQPAQTGSPAAEPALDPNARQAAPTSAEQKPGAQTQPRSLPQGQSAQTPPAGPSSLPQDAPATKPAASTAKRRVRKHKTQKPDPPPSTSTKKVVSNGGTAEPEIQISPRLSEKQQADERQKIAALLAVTETNLQKVAGRNLKSNEEEMAKQIRMYMDQAKQATEAGDLQRAQNFASKANLLSIELAGK